MTWCIRARHLRVLGLAAGTALGIALAGCAGPAGRSAVGPDLGGQIEAQFGGVIESPAAAPRLNMAIERIASVTPGVKVSCRGALLNSQRLNALSLSDGRIYVTRGLYEQLSDAQLLAVIAHEMAHIEARDGKSAAANGDGQLTREIHADRRAWRYLVQLLNLLTPEQPKGWSQKRVEALLRTSMKTSPHGREALPTGLCLGH